MLMRLIESYLLTLFDGIMQNRFMESPASEDGGSVPVGCDGLRGLCGL